MKVLFRPDDIDSKYKITFSFLKHPFFCLVGMRGVVSQHSEIEDALLRKYAKDAKTIVEIGVAEGASAFSLRDVASPKTTLYLIDPYLPGRLPFFNATKLVAHRYVGSSSNVTVEWIEAFSYDVCKNWDKPIDFLFIDGDHSYEGCLRDWKEWSPFISKNGIVAFHDARVFDGGWTKPSDGPVQVINELFKGSPDNSHWQIIEEIGSLVIVRRTK